MDTVILVLSLGTLVCVGIALQINHSFMKTQREINRILMKDIEDLEKDIEKLEESIKSEIQLRRVLGTDVRRNEGAIHEAAEWAHDVDLFRQAALENNVRLNKRYTSLKRLEKENAADGKTPQTTES